jgi:HEAT repeat protein
MDNVGDTTGSRRSNLGRDLAARVLAARPIGLIVAAILLGFFSCSSSGDTPENRFAVGLDVDHPMYLDPVLEWPRKVGVFSPRLRELWLAALKRPHAQTRLLAVEAIIDAHRRGMKGWGQSADLLIEMFESPTEHPEVRLALAKALAELDARSSADVLLKACKNDQSDLILIVDPAMVAWDHKPARALWRQRIASDPTSRVSCVVRISAIRALASVKDTQAIEPLKVLAMNLAEDPDLGAALRLEAARALGVLASNALEDDAEALMAATGSSNKARHSVLDRLVAVHLLRGHASDRARKLLIRLADDPVPSVAAVALRRLLTLDAKVVFSRAEKLAAGRDSSLRRIAVEALILQADTAAVATLGLLLDDPDRALRVDVRKALARLASKQPLADAVAQAAIKQLNSDRWRALEQAAFLVAKIDHKSAGKPLTGLLDFNHPQVRMAAIVALRRLKVESTSQAMLKRAQFLAIGARAYRKPIQDNGFPMDPSIEKELSQLFQTLGLMKYEPTDPLMRQFISKGSRLPPEARSAAIWGLGYIHQAPPNTPAPDAPDPTLVKLLIQRLTDESDTDPEYDEVRRMAGVSLGRMKAKSAMGTLKRFHRTQFLIYYTGGACRWAIMRMTGQQLPASPQTREFQERGWFLEPLY